MVIFASPIFHILAARETRYYSFLLMISVLSIKYLVNYLLYGFNKANFLIVSTIGLLSHYLYTLIAITHLSVLILTCKGGDIFL